jgi:putative endonuclease
LYTVYAIKSLVKNYIYVGLTTKLNDRFKRHNSGYERTTRSYKPFELIFTEEHNLRQDARKREKYLKSGIGKEFLKSLLNK